VALEIKIFIEAINFTLKYLKDSYPGIPSVPSVCEK
jgi:hypothetical protein